MTPDDLDDLTPAERGGLEPLPREAAPPPWLESRVLDALRARGLVRPASAGRFRCLAAAGLATAAAAVIFAAGLGVGSRTGRQVVAAPAGPRFVLFLYEADDYERPLPDAAAGRVEEYRRWAASLGARGVLLDGEKLKDDGSVLEGTDGTVLVRSGLPVSEEGVLAGYFIVTARDAAEAAAIARDCPHLKHRGRISIREIDPV